MAPRPCEYPGCDWAFESNDPKTFLEMLRIHCHANHPQPAGAGGEDRPSTRAEKAKRPELASEVSDEDWDYFLARWERYKTSTKLVGEEIVTQLLECCCDQLRRDHHRTFLSDKKNEELTEETLKTQLKQIAVQKRNLLVNRFKVFKLKQDRGELVRKFAGRVRSLAAVSGYSVKNGDTEVSYTEEVIRDQVIFGLADLEIQRDVLAHQDGDKITLENLLSFVEGKESSQTSQGLLKGGSVEVTKVHHKSGYKCGWCGESHPRGKDNCKASGHKCQKCQKLGHLEKVCRSKPAQQQNSDESQAECSIFIPNKDFIYPDLSFKKEAEFKSLTNKKERPARACTKRRGKYDKIRKERTDPLPAIEKKNFTQNVLNLLIGCTISTTKIRDNTKLFAHHVHDKETGRWVMSRPRDKPYVKLMVEFDKEAASELQMKIPSQGTRQSSWSGMCDTGASVTMCGKYFLRKLGIGENQATQCLMSLTNADESPINVVGAIPVIITDIKTNIFTKQILYIAGNSNGLLLSQEACIDLQYINKDFPSKEPEQICSAKAGKKPGCDCSCPVRSRAPDPPDSLPFEPVPENVPKLEQWIRDFYAASAFNVCECQPLPEMHGPPLKIFLQDGAKPVAAHTPIPIPIHWQKEVKAGLDRDEAIGVIEKVPPGTPTTWCHRMVCVPKKDNTPRRTVNFQPLNQYSSRQTHHTMSPFHQASMVPANTKKTVLDAWNGYHSVALDPACKDLTTFLTPWGRYRYRKAPMGYLAAGDAYTERFDKIITDVKNKTKCVDDTVLWAQTIQESFHQTCSFLSLCSQNGIVFNQKKFQFCRDEVEFAGFMISSDSVRPSEKILESIRDFPVPKTISNVRGWFGLVNQVAPFFANRPVMEPFRELLKPSAAGKAIYWDENLTKLFEESKIVIISAIREGIKCFRAGDVTCLMPDFCKTGIGFLLTQKRCRCEKISPYCCPGGWQVVLAGSRFTKGPETRYAPVEGEALAVAWSLEATKHYTLGNPKLLVATDHKPLLKVLGDRKLEDIDNPRLLKLKEKTLRWKFDIIHVPGKIHVGPDTLSRKETSACLVDVVRDQEAAWDEREMESLIEHQVAAVTPISWQQIREEVARDKVMRLLSDQIVQGFPPDRKLLRLELREYYHHRDHLSQVDGVPLFKGRVVVPAGLRKAVLETLHSAHQGVTGMTLRAQSSVWWPGITPQIKETRDKCRICHENTPSQPSAPPEPLLQPDYPFQQIAADYFQAGGHHYLVIVDRFSGWPAVQFCGSSSSSSSRLREWLRQYFATYGIPEELSTDGGLTFTAYETEKFLKDYGVRHRLSSVAFPHSNQRAELGVKSMKRLIRENTGSDGSLSNDKFLMAIMQYRNTPDRDTGLSPAQVIFGRNLRDFLPAPQTRYKPHSQWILLREDRERALAKRAVSNMEKLTIGTRALPPLAVGDSVLVQNQIGNHPSKWDITGVIVERKDFDQYVVKVDGSGRLTMRNRKFLRKITPYQLTKHFPDSSLRPATSDPPAVSSPPPTPDTETGPVTTPDTETGPVTTQDPPSTESPELPSVPPSSPAREAPTPPEPRRSSRARREPDRLADKMRFGGKSYEDTSTSSIVTSLPHCWTSGGGGITEHARTKAIWRPVLLE